MVNQSPLPPVTTGGRNILKRSLKIIFKSLLYVIGGGMFLVILLNLYVSWSTQAQIYTHIDKMPYRPYAVVLGTAKYSVNKGNKHFNQFYLNRLLAVEQLFNQKKVSFLLLSGDNRTFRYNEPRSMFQDLQKMGIPVSAMRLDFAGFRTLDSVIRAKKVFQLEPFTLVSQKFHCERALFIANYHHINAICFAAPTPKGYPLVQIREFFARILAFWDILTNKQPYYLGKPEPLPSLTNS